MVQFPVLTWRLSVAAKMALPAVVLAAGEAPGLVCPAGKGPSAGGRPFVVVCSTSRFLPGVSARLSPL
jgi:hypothetical protein